MSLKAGQFVRVLVVPRGIDLSVSLSAPDGRELVGASNKSSIEADAPVLWVADVDGVYRLNVRALEPNAREGSYEAKITELRAGAQRDRSLAAAEAALWSGNTLLDRGSMETLPAAMDKFGEALAHLRAAGDLGRAAYPMRRQAAVLLAQNRPDDARELREEALRLTRLGYGREHLKVAPALWDMADSAARAGEQSRARALHEEAEKIIEKTAGPDSIAAAIGLGYKAQSLAVQGDSKGALEAARRALKIWQQHYGPDSLNVASASGQLANILSGHAYLAQAQESYERVIRIYERHYGVNAPQTIYPLSQLAQVMTRRGDGAAARSKQELIVRIVEREHGPNSLQAAQALWETGNLLAQLGQYADARAAYERSVRIVGPNSPRSASALAGIARTFAEEGDNANARAQFDEIIRIFEQREGPDSPTIAYTLILKAEAYHQAKDYEEGSRLFERALKIYAKYAGEESHWVASTLMSAGDFDSTHKKYPEARAKYERALKVYEKKDGPESASVALALWRIGESLSDELNSEKAVEPLRRSVNIYEKIYGPNSPFLLRPLRDLGGAYLEQNLLGETVELLRRSLKILEENQLGEELAATSTLLPLAGLLMAEGKLDAAKEVGERGLKIYEKHQHHDSRSDELNLRNSYGMTLVMKGDLVAARPFMEETIRMAGAGKAHSPELLVALSYMAHLLITQGDREMAAAYIDRVVRAAPTLVESGEPMAIQALMMAATISFRVGKQKEGRDLLDKSFELAEKTFGPRNIATAVLVGNQALLLLEAGDYALANEKSAKADEIFKEIDPGFYLRLLPLAARGEILIRLGKLAEGRSVIEEAVRVFEKQVGANHYLAVQGSMRLGWLDYFYGDVARAQSSFLRSAGVTYDFMRNILPTLSLAEQRIFLETEVPEQLSGLLTLCRDGANLRGGYEVMFRWKGGLIDLLRRQTLITNAGRSGPHAAQVKQLQAVRAQLAGWYYQSNTVPAARWRQKNGELTAEKERLEREVARALQPGALEDPLATGLKDFQRLLRQDEVFLDVYLYDYRKKDDTVEERYAAVVTEPTGDPALVDLGSAKNINGAVAAWRNEVLSAYDAEEQRAALAKLLWKPLADALPPNARKVWVSPDGELARVPWHLLPAPGLNGGRLLLTQTDSARELARLKRARHAPASPAAGAILLAGNIDFNAGLPPSGPRAVGSGFAPLGGTKTEVESIRALGERLRAEVTLLTGPRADKRSIVAALQNATYAHLATHGFFAREAKEIMRAAGEVRQASPLEGGPPPVTRNPLVESGIALAGANVRDPLTFDRPGLLSAEEIVGLDLARSELVTLSACETGRGQEVTGQGVMGLRASVMAAGSKSMLMSLWKVPDEATVKFMEAFYANLWFKKMTRAEALLRAQESVRDHPSGAYKKPVYWAAWVLVGEAW